MSLVLAYILIGIGVALLALGILLGGLPFSAPSGFWTALLGGASLTGASVWLQQLGRDWRQSAQWRKANRNVSSFAEPLISQLYGEYSPYVIEAAEKLGAARDTTAVPALLWVLEECVVVQRPGWCEVAEALANALGQIGDARALPLLYRLDNVCGIGLIPSIRQAIAVIEPQSVLLRPGSPDPQTLLRPAQTRSPETDPAILLRSVRSD
jgi:hypothetical protein